MHTGITSSNILIKIKEKNVRKIIFHFLKNTLFFLLKIEILSRINAHMQKLDVLSQALGSQIRFSTSYVYPFPYFSQINLKPEILSITLSTIYNINM